MMFGGCVCFCLSRLHHQPPNSAMEARTPPALLVALFFCIDHLKCIGPNSDVFLARVIITQALFSLQECSPWIFHIDSDSDCWARCVGHEPSNFGCGYVNASCTSRYCNCTQTDVRREGRFKEKSLKCLWKHSHFQSQAERSMSVSASLAHRLKCIILGRFCTAGRRGGASVPL